MNSIPVRLLLVASLLVVSNGATAQGLSPTSAEEAKVISALGLAPGKVVGEIGAGDGKLTILAAKTVAPGGKVFATELGESKRETLKRNVDEAGVANVEVLAAQLESTGFAAACCDAILMRDVYHHLTAPEAILTDIAKALRPGGRLLIIDFEPRDRLPKVDGVRENRRGHGIPVGVLVQELQAAGFKVVSQDGAWRSDLFAVVAQR